MRWLIIQDEATLNDQKMTFSPRLNENKIGQVSKSISDQIDRFVYSKTSNSEQRLEHCCSSVLAKFSATIALQSFFSIRIAQVLAASLMLCDLWRAEQAQSNLSGCRAHKINGSWPHPPTFMSQDPSATPYVTIINQLPWNVKDTSC